jgi:hypothetical protein
MGESDISPDEFEKTFLALSLMLCDSAVVCQCLSGACDQWDDSLKAVTKLSRIRDEEKYKSLEFLGESLAVFERDTLEN